MIAPALLAPLWLLACSGDEPKDTANTADDSATDSADSATDSQDTARTDTDTAADTADTDDTADTADTGTEPIVYEPWPFLDAVTEFSFGEGAGYGQDRFPDVVFGPPEAPGDGGGSLDVVSLGREGWIVASFRDLDLVDGEGPDLLIFENPFTGWYETGVVGVSEDGVDWVEWPCDPEDAAGGYPGCAGVALVYANSGNGVDATDPEAAGGDRFDLADIGVSRARFVRVRDSGANSYEGVSGGFDFDAAAAIHAEPQ